MLRVPRFYSRNFSIKPLKLQGHLPKGDPNRRPLGVYPVPVVICHGSRTPAAVHACENVEARGGIYLNHPYKIAKASCKPVSKQMMLDNDIPTTKFTLDNEEVMDLKFPIVAKLKRGFGGEGMQLLHSGPEFIEWLKVTEIAQYFWEECFNYRKTLDGHMKTTREYRISCSPLLKGVSVPYIFEGRTQTCSTGEIVSLRKLMRNGDISDEKFGRNLSTGQGYFKREFARSGKYRSGATLDFQEGIDIALKTVEVLGLDYGAVDIMWSSVTGEWSVLEVNTAPSMGDLEKGHSYTLNMWKCAFKAMIETKLLNQNR